MNNGNQSVQETRGPAWSPFINEQDHYIQQLVQSIEEYVLIPLVERKKKHHEEKNNLREWTTWVNETLKNVWGDRPENYLDFDTNHRLSDDIYDVRLLPFTTFIMANDPSRQQYYYITPRKKTVSSCTTLRMTEQRVNDLQRVRIPWGRGIIDQVAREEDDGEVNTKGVKSFDNIFSNPSLTFRREDIVVGNRSIIMTSIFHEKEKEVEERAEWIIGVYSPITGIFEHSDESVPQACVDLKRIADRAEPGLRILRRFIDAWLVENDIRTLSMSSELGTQKSHYQSWMNQWKQIAAALSRSRALSPEWVGIWIEGWGGNFVLAGSQVNPFTIRREVFNSLPYGANAKWLSDWYDRVTKITGGVDVSCYEDVPYIWHPYDKKKENTIVCSGFIYYFSDEKSRFVVLIRHSKEWLLLETKKENIIASIGRALQRLIQDKNHDWMKVQEFLQELCQGISSREVENIPSNEFEQILLESEVHSITILQVLSDVIPEPYFDEDKYQEEITARQIERNRQGIIPNIADIEGMPEYPLSEDECSRKISIRINNEYKVDNDRKDQFLRWCRSALLYFGVDVEIDIVFGQNGRKLPDTIEEFYNVHWKYIWGECQLRGWGVDLQEDDPLIDDRECVVWKQANRLTVCLHVEAYYCKETEMLIKESPWYTKRADKIAQQLRNSFNENRGEQYFTCYTNIDSVEEKEISIYAFDDKTGVDGGKTLGYLAIMGTPRYQAKEWFWRNRSILSALSGIRLAQLTSDTLRQEEFIRNVRHELRKNIEAFSSRALLDLPDIFSVGESDGSWAGKIISIPNELESELSNWLVCVNTELYDGLDILVHVWFGGASLPRLIGFKEDGELGDVLLKCETAAKKVVAAQRFTSTTSSVSVGSYLRTKQRFLETMAELSKLEFVYNDEALAAKWINSDDGTVINSQQEFIRAILALFTDTLDNTSNDAKCIVLLNNNILRITTENILQSAVDKEQKEISTATVLAMCVRSIGGSSQLIFRGEDPNTHKYITNIQFDTNNIFH